MQNERTKSWVENTLKRSKSKEKKTSDQPSSSASAVEARPLTEDSLPGAFTCAFSTVNYNLQGSWILDNGSDCHVCNHTMYS